MSRFEEVVNEAIGEVVLGEARSRPRRSPQHIAELVRERQGARRAEVTIAARYPEHKPAPVSGIQTQEIYTLFGSAVASERGTRRLVGVAGAGHDRLPVRAGARRRRARASGSPPTASPTTRSSASSRPCRSRRTTSAASARCTSAAPRSCDGRDRRARRCWRSSRTRCRSEIYELMKRSDEAAVVEKAHRRPRFVEDCVREMIARRRRALRRRSATRAFVSARQENLETIHQHNVVAERFGLLGELRARARDRRARRRAHVTMREWLDAAG